MGENSPISWTDHTFNPWWGCVKVSPACTNCYAATFDHRLGGDHWGPKSERKFFGDKHWDGPRKWNRAAQKAGIRARVLCASMADVFEDRLELIGPRTKLFALIAQTPWLDWLLLTKRPGNLPRMLPWTADPHASERSEPWSNVWLGTTVENQEYADERIPGLLDVPAVVHFVSCEPLLGALDLRRWLGGAACLDAFDGTDGIVIDPSLSWVIAGCESGHGARRTDVEWFRSLREQCETAAVSFLLKQATETVESVLQGEGSKRKGSGVIELPYLDGVQHASFPRVTADQAEAMERKP